MKTISMKKISVVFLCLLLLAPAGFAAEVFDWVKQPYVEHPFAPVDLSNSAAHPAVAAFGQHLSLALRRDGAGYRKQSRYSARTLYICPPADTELQRAKGGGVLRGLTYNVFEVPVGVGGPASPLVTAAATPSVGAAGSVPTNPSELGALSEQLDNLSLLQSVPLSPGPAIPQFDPALTGQLNWTHQTTPDTDPSGLRRQRSYRQHHQRQCRVHARLRPRHGIERRLSTTPATQPILCRALLAPTPRPVWDSPSRSRCCAASAWP